jgi:hypothetical protein
MSRRRMCEWAQQIFYEYEETSHVVHSQSVVECQYDSSQGQGESKGTYHPRHFEHYGAAFGTSLLLLPLPPPSTMGDIVIDFGGNFSSCQAAQTYLETQGCTVNSSSISSNSNSSTSCAHDPTAAVNATSGGGAGSSSSSMEESVLTLNFLTEMSGTYTGASY